MPGVGKTTLAVHWAHLCAASFPDGQLFIDMQGYSPSGPVAATEALRRFLQALGTAATEVPPGLDDRTAMYRTRLAGARILVVLDNAADAAQIRPLLPGAPGCMVLVTSRDRQTGMVARDDAAYLPLDVLDPQESGSLLASALGHERFAGQEDAVAELARLCSHLPLALRVAAANLLSRPGDRLATYLAELTLGDRLAGLDAAAGELAAVGAAFDLSYQRLAPGVKRLFRLLGLHTGPDIDVHAASALVDSEPSAVTQDLRSLAAAHLVDSQDSRYRMHDLLRVFAARRAEHEESTLDRAAALERVRVYYTESAEAAANLLYAEPLPASVAQRFGSAVTANEWLEAELTNIVATTRGAYGHAARVSTALYRYLDARNRHTEAELVHGDALEIARKHQDHRAHAEALNRLGTVSMRLGRFGQARVQTLAAQHLWAGLGDTEAEAVAVANLGIIALHIGDLNDGIILLERGSSLFQDPVRKARSLHNLGVVHNSQRKHEKAIEFCQRACDLHRAAGNNTGMALSLAILGDAHGCLGAHAKSLEFLTEALELHRRHGHPRGVADVNNALANHYRRRGDLDKAMEHHAHALDYYRRSPGASDKELKLNDLGLTLAASGRHSEARQAHQEALVLAQQSGNRMEIARAHEGLGDLEPAIELYQSMGVVRRD